ncbi:MAG: tRNA pseudouridine(55) synthase TruB [Granulosicoccus sp.]
MGRRNRKGRRLHGILLLDKPAGGSSNRALQQVKRLFDAQKAGHTGSLDPLATGMLPICFGEATKFGSLLLDADKGYETTITLGITTDSADADGVALERRPVPAGLDRQQIEAVCLQFTGEQLQIPPMVSAIKVNGQRLYKLAREGKVVERKPRPVNIMKIDVLQVEGVQIRLAVCCSKGTYIRSLATDIGEKLGCGAHVAALRRTFVSPFQLGTLHTREALEAVLAIDGIAGLDRCLLPLDAGLHHLARVDIDTVGLEAFGRGQSAEITPVESAVAAQSERASNGDARRHEQAAIEPLTALAAASVIRVYGPDGRLAGLGKQTDGSNLVTPSRVIQW